MDRSRSNILTHIMDCAVRRALLAAALAAAGMHPASTSAATHHLRQLRVPVLVFHHVQPFRASDDAIERGLTILPSQFQQEVVYLTAHRFHVLTAARVVSALLQGHSLPDRPVVLSFDDGYSDMATHVVPVLRRYHLAATFFIAPGLLNKPRYLNWKQVELMSRQGMDIEAHTVTHPDLTLVSRAQARGEIYDSRRILQAHIHRAVRLFAYPYGDYNAYVLQTVHRAGFVAGFTTRQGWWLNRASILTLPRVYIDNDDTLRIFAGRLAADPSVLAQDPT